MAHPSLHPYSITSTSTSGRIDRRIDRQRKYSARRAVEDARIAEWIEEADDELQAAARFPVMRRLDSKL